MTDPDFKFYFSAQDKQQLEAANIDYRLTLELLRNLKQQRTMSQQSTRLEIPEVDNRQIIDCRGAVRIQTNHDRSIARLSKYIPYSELQSNIIPRLQQHTTDNMIQWDRKLLTEVGEALYSVCAYGMLNGGSATSYIDPIHNRRMNSSLFEEWKPIFENAREQYAHLPKALCPALYHSNGTAGATFMELRVRHLLHASAKAHREGGAGIKLFQMTSQSNHNTIVQATEDAFASCCHGESRRVAQALYRDTSRNGGEVLCASQPLIATFAHHGETELSLKATPSLFRTPQTGTVAARANTSPPSTPYGLPGGHGQSLYVLRPMLQKLFADGVRFVFIGNIDNLGYTMNPISLAYLVLHDGEALFEAVPRSAVDVKGGVLARRTVDGKLCNAELGSEGIDMETIARSERDDKLVLFNCAIGLFDLERLLLKLDDYLSRLPVHCLHKKTARGEYWQLEQITWDIIGLIDTPHILVSNKAERFLAAKLIFETFLLSGLPMKTAVDLPEIAPQLHSAMKQVMANDYGVEYRAGEWHTENT